MHHVILEGGAEGSVVDAVVGIEALVLRVDQGFPEYGVHVLVVYGSAVLAEKLSYLLTVGTVNL